MRHFPFPPVLVCSILTITSSLFAENLWDVVEETQGIIIRKYPSEESIARRLALKELEEIASGNMSEALKIETIRKKYPTYNQHGNLVFKVKPGATYEIGRLEMGWCFLRGERYTLNASGYIIPIEGKVP